MTSTTSPPPATRFRVSDLIYDARYRSLVIQIVAMVLLVLAFSWLLSNTVRNLNALGRDFDFSYLSERAGYDINQRLIPYSSDSSHARAALVGILNTLLVAVMGCAAATVVGLVVGVLRLSKNWLVARLMAIYVEGFRNVPLLLWIVIIFAVLTEAAPTPRDFEGDGSSMLLGSVAITNRGVYVPAPVWGDGTALLGVVLVASLVAIWAWRRYARARQIRTGEILPVVWVSVALLILPTLAAYVALGSPVTLDYPEVGTFNFSGGLHLRNSLIALWLALSLYTAAFIAEIVRAGILSVARGQTEAAFALGLGPRRTMERVILPQALRVIVPPLISQYLNLTKNSSLAIAVGYMDVRSTLGGISVNQTGRELEGMLLLGGFYLLLSLAIASVMNLYNSRVKLKER